MRQVQLSDRQSSFIFYLIHQGKGRTEAARLTGFAVLRMGNQPGKNLGVIVFLKRL